MTSPLKNLMPKLSQFFGIDIILRSREDPHFRAHFTRAMAKREVSIAIETLEILAGKMNRRALALVIEWAILHRPELQAAWDDLKAGCTPRKIEPLH